MVGPPLVIRVIIGYPIVRAVYLSFVGDSSRPRDRIPPGTFGTSSTTSTGSRRRTSNTDASVRVSRQHRHRLLPAVRNTAMFTVVTVSIETVLGF